MRSAAALLARASSRLARSSQWDASGVSSAMHVHVMEASSPAQHAWSSAGCWRALSQACRQGEHLPRSAASRAAGMSSDAASSSSDREPSSSSSSSNSSSDNSSGRQALGSAGRGLVMVFTCSKCDTRSAKSFSRRAYDHGLVLVRCPGCDSQHLIADHLGWFGDKGFTVEGLMESLGQPLKRLDLDQAAAGAAGAAGVAGEAAEGGLTAEDVAGWSKVQNLLEVMGASSDGKGTQAASTVEEQDAQQQQQNQQEGLQQRQQQQRQDSAAAAVGHESANYDGVVEVSPEDAQAWRRVQQTATHGD